MIDFVFAYYFVIDPNKFLNCGLLSSSFRVFSFQLFVPSKKTFKDKSKHGKLSRWNQYYPLN